VRTDSGGNSRFIAATARKVSSRLRVSSEGDSGKTTRESSAGTEPCAVFMQARYWFVKPVLLMIDVASAPASATWRELVLVPLGALTAPLVIVTAPPGSEPRTSGLIFSFGLRSGY